MKGRSTTPYMVRLPDEVAEWLKLRANGESVGVYIKEMILKAYKKRGDYTIPLYNPADHKAGDRVLVRQGKRLVETIIPELDAEGNPIPAFD